MMIGVKDQNDKRDAWHHGGWMAKIVFWAVLVALMFFLPNVVITIYGMLSSTVESNYAIFCIFSVDSKVLKFYEFI